MAVQDFRGPIPPRLSFGFSFGFGLALMLFFFATFALALVCFFTFFRNLDLFRIFLAVRSLLPRLVRSIPIIVTSSILGKRRGDHRPMRLQSFNQTVEVHAIVIVGNIPSGLFTAIDQIKIPRPEWISRR